MTSYDDIVKRWLDVRMGRTPNKSLFGDNYRVWADGDRIYSYGTHFELARIIRDRKGQPSHFLLNGERYVLGTWTDSKGRQRTQFSTTTPRHQATVRSHVRKEGLPVVILPHPALRASGIDLDTIEIVDVVEDEWMDVEHVTTELPAGGEWKDFPAFRKERRSDADIEESLDLLWEHEKQRNKNAQRPTRDAVDESFLCDYVPDGTERVYLVNGYREVRAHIRHDGVTEYRWTTHEHRLGESVIKARVNYEATHRCGACKSTGRTSPDPLDAMRHYDDWLAANGKPGDTDAVYYRWVDARKAAQDAGRCTKCRGVGGTRMRRQRTAYFLSSFDRQEPSPLYFFCELPRGARPKTVAEAVDALKPEAVRLAEQMGRAVRRQGDIFAIELRGADKRSLRKAGARFEKRGNLLGTNHVATEVAYMPDGTTLMRGVLIHAPEGRRPDHVRCPLDAGWHVAVKNTVPVTR